MKKEELIQITFKVTKEKAETLKRLSAKKYIPLAELVRRLVDKGLNLESSREDIDFIADIIRDELTAIYRLEDIKDILERQVNRLTKMMMKIGKINSGQLFLLINMFLRMIDEAEEDRFDELLEMSIRNGINYMQKKDFAINDFLQDINNLKNIAKDL